MDDKMESDQSFSGESSSSSDSTSSSSDGDEEVMESVRILGQTLELPQELCEDYSVFKEFFSMKTWEALDGPCKDELKKYLPKFTENEEEETEKTLKMLLNHETFHFTSPISDFYNNLRQGNYRPDIAKMRKFLRKAKAKQQRHKIKSYYARLLPEVLISRERVLAAAKTAPPGPVPRLSLIPPKPSSKMNYKPLFLRAKQRYFEELAAIQSEVGGDESDDLNFPDGPPELSMRKRKQVHIGQNMDGNVSGTLGGSETSHPTSLACLKNILAAHRSRRQYRETHPELNTAGISLDDIKQRVALVNGTKKLMFGGQKTDSPIQKMKRGPKKDSGKGKTQDTKTAIKKSKEEQQESVENKPLLPNIKIKCEQEESDSENSSFVEAMTSPKHGKKLLDHTDIKQEVVDSKYPNITNVNYSDAKLEHMIKQEPPDPTMAIQNASRLIQPVPIKLEDLDGIDMMALPVELADDSGDVIPVDTSGEGEDQSVDPDESLTETTHTNFLSLVRALFPARAAHRASKQQLIARCSAVMKSPIAPLNTWYSLSEDWCSELGSALDFLAGERGPHPDDFVPYLQFLPETQMYQWIGAGRDCDAILGRLCERWLRAVSPGPPTSEPPPPRYPTSWVMRAPTVAEVAEFRAQERRRFAAAAKAFTYMQHGYRSIVGPCARASVACGTQGSLLAADRPRHASFVALVRDAVARLPNGEGTRHDVLTLLKMSQWIGLCNDQALLGALSSALDRLHAAKRDPIVKYDQRTAVWTYLYRNRTEEDWVKTGRGRGGKAAAAAAAAAIAASNAAAAAESAATAATPPPQRPTQPRPTQRETQHLAPQPAMELEIGSVEEVIENASDSDVDVDDTSSSVPHLSSAAQLLMQATQATQPTPAPQATQPAQTPQLPQTPQTPQSKPPPVTPKTKGKLVAAPTKAKANAQAKPTTSKQGNLMTQSVKQANLLSQAAKRATLMSQAVKRANLLSQTVKESQLAAKQANQAQKPTPPLQTIKQNTVTQAKQTNAVAQKSPQAQAPKQTTPKQTNVIQAKPVSVTKQPAQSPKSSTVQAKQAVVAQTKQAVVPQTKQAVVAQTKQAVVAQTKQTVVAQTKQTVVAQLKQAVMAQTKQAVVAQTKQAVVAQTKQVVVAQTKQAQQKNATAQLSQANAQAVAQISKSLPSVVAPPHKSPLIKQRPLQRVETPQTSSVSAPATPTHAVTPPTQTTLAVSTLQTQNKLVQGTRSLLIRPPAVQTTVTAAVSTPITQAVPTSRRGVVRVLSPATPSSGKSLISPRALLQQGATTVPSVPAAKKRTSIASTTAVAPILQAAVGTSVVSSVPTVATSSVSTRTVQLAGGRTVQLAANQTVHLPGGQAVQLTSGHTLQLSSLQLPTHSVRLPSGQTVQLASPQTMQAVRAVSTTAVKNPSPRAAQSSPTVKTVQTSQALPIPVSTVQLSGQTVQIAGQTVQLAGQSVQLTGHTVKLPSGQSVQVASQSAIPSQSVQLPSGQTVQLASGNVQTVHLGSNIQLPSGQSVQMPSGQTVQLGGQTVQLAGGQTVQLPSGQTLQLSSGQTVQLSSGQTLQLASGQTVQLANQQGPKITQVVRSQSAGDKTTQPIVAKLLTNAQGQMISLEGMMGARGVPQLQVAGVRPRAAVRVLSPARPLLLTAAKPLHNIILQQGDGTAIRVTSSSGPTTSQTIVLSNLGAQAVTTTSTTPVLKLQQVNPIQQVKLAQGIKIQQASSAASSTTATPSGVRSVLMDGQQLKLVGGRHVLARILRPAHPPP